MEAGISGWSGTLGTPSQSSARAFEGTKCLRLTTAGGGQCKLLYAISGLENGKTYQLDAMMWIPSGWDGGEVWCVAEDFTGLTYGLYQDGSPGHADSWQGVYVRFTIAADGSGNVGWKSQIAPSASKWFEVDDVRLREVLE